MIFLKWIAPITVATFSTPALAAESAHLEGAQLGAIWAVPFVAMLLSIALFPLLAPKFWEHHFGKVAAFWASAFLIPATLLFGISITAAEIVHTIALEYIPFIILLFSLFVVSGGISLSGNITGAPATNTAILAIGTIAASIVGTTGASMLLIRPLIVANRHRQNNAHVFIFFIFLVSNIGGSLTPLGDPPLFLGFLKGVDFLWTVTAMLPPMALCAAILLIVFFAIDRFYWHREGKHRSKERSPHQIKISGLHNLAYLAGIVFTVLMSGVWDSGVSLPVGFGLSVPLEGLARDVILLLLGYLSWGTTRKSIRLENAFTWTPILEVAYLFAGIFITIIPIIAMLRAGRDGSFAPLLALVTSPDGRPNEVAYFWLAGGLSSFLDNAPTYLVFFNLAGGDAQQLMGPLFKTLLAISAGAVFMGANTYIGNAPNFMVKSICEERGIRMPSFFGYMIWSGLILLPLFALVTVIFF